MISRHVTRDNNLLHGEPIIVGTKTPVRAIVELWRLGDSPEDIPNHTSNTTISGQVRIRMGERASPAPADT